MSNHCDNNLREDMPKIECSNNHKKQIDFYTFKEDIISSLNQVEYFLNNYKQMIKYIKLYKLLK